MTDIPKWDDALTILAQEAWNVATVPQQEHAIREATKVLDSLPYKGSRLTDHQGLAWPRKDVFLDDGSPVTGVPAEIKEAAALLAGIYLVHAGIKPAGLAHALPLISHLLEK